MVAMLDTPCKVSISSALANVLRKGILKIDDVARKARRVLERVRQIAKGQTDKSRPFHPAFCAHVLAKAAGPGFRQYES